MVKMKNLRRCWSIIFIILVFGSEIVSAATKQDEDEGSSGFFSNDNVVFGLKTAAVAGATIVGAPIVLGAAGFTGAGITAGSLAAYYQSTMLGGTIMGGSMFAGLQSLGAAGLGVGAKAAVAAVSGAGVKLYESMSGSKNDGDSGECGKKEIKKDCTN